MGARLIIDAIIGQPSGLYGSPKSDDSIVSAAILDPDTGDIYVGDSHWDCKVNWLRSLGYEPHDDDIEDADLHGVEGFITASGKFFNRVEALKIAASTRQVKRPDDLR